MLLYGHARLAAQSVQDCTPLGADVWPHVLRTVSVWEGGPALRPGFVQPLPGGSGGRPAGGLPGLQLVRAVASEGGPWAEGGSTWFSPPECCTSLHHNWTAGGKRGFPRLSEAVLPALGLGWQLVTCRDRRCGCGSEKCAKMTPW